MDRQATIQHFVSARKLALVGMSRSGKKFGNAVFKELSAKGYSLFPIHPEAGEIDGQSCFSSLDQLPEPVVGLICVVPPAQTEVLVDQAAQAGIPAIWMQQGSESPAAIARCEQLQLPYVDKACILMYARPSGFHKFHAWLHRLTGK